MGYLRLGQVFVFPQIPNAFVTKEHLSKVLLEYVLALPLLPEIGDER